MTLPSDPHLRRWMMFVDGENLTCRAQELAEDKNIPLREGPYYTRDVMVWLPQLRARYRLVQGVSGIAELQLLAVRAYYYTSAIGSEEVVDSIRRKLWAIGFQPTVFKKPKNRVGSKGVDIALTTDLLSNAYRNNYGVAVLVAGDGDYVPLVEEVKRLGKIVYVVFFGKEGGLSPNLQLAADDCGGLEPVFEKHWLQHGFKD